MPFAKIDTALHRNPKIVRAGADAREVYLFVLLINGELEAGGVLSDRYVDPDYLATQIQRDRNACVTAVTACVTHKLLVIEGANVRISGWSDEWGRRPRSNKERQASWRRRHENNGAVTGEVTNNANNGREEKRREISDLAAHAKKRSRSNGAKTPLPEAWAPNDTHAKIGRELGRDLNREATEFREDALAHGRVYASWDMAFCKWLRNERYRSNGARQAPAQTALTEIRKIRTLVP